MMLSVVVTTFRSQATVTLLILYLSFCFLRFSLLMADLQPKRLHVSEVYTATV